MRRFGVDAEPLQLYETGEAEKILGEEKWRQRWQKKDIERGNVWKRKPNILYSGNESFMAYAT